MYIIVVEDRLMINFLHNMQNISSQSSIMCRVCNLKVIEAISAETSSIYKNWLSKVRNLYLIYVTE